MELVKLNNINCRKRGILIGSTGAFIIGIPLLAPLGGNKSAISVIDLSVSWQSPISREVMFGCSATPLSMDLAPASPSGLPCTL